MIYLRKVGGNRFLKHGINFLKQTAYLRDQIAVHDARVLDV